MKHPSQQPNVVFLFADQWRQQATGYSGDPNVHTPNLDKLAKESIIFTRAVSGCPVCSPYRASLLTGQRPLTHGVFVNDVPLQPKELTLGEAFANAGYSTGYIGKWHVDGHGRSSYIPPERHRGFEYWKVLECTHNYNKSPYYADDSDVKRYWEGYDAIAQTRDAESFLHDHRNKQPFALVVSWGPPHDPYHTAPEQFRNLYQPETIRLRENVPEDVREEASHDLAGYYAHCTALDFCVGRILQTLHQCDLLDNTLLVFTSDHGDMLGSQGERNKQRPWDESILVPFLMRLPTPFGRRPRTLSIPIDAPDIMPTLLSLCDIPIPETVEGLDYSKNILGETNTYDETALITCPHPFGQWSAPMHGGREYRGIRTNRYTYVKDLRGPWLLYDNKKDPLQMMNLVHDPQYTKLCTKLDDALKQKLESTGDLFLPGSHYLREWGYTVDKTGTVPYTE